MPKRKATSKSGEAVLEDVDMGNTAGADSDNDSDSDMEILNVDFEMFDPQPAIDFHGLRTLLRQLFDIDNTLFDISALSDLILSQPLLGTTVKVDGNESDPYAFLTVINMTEHAEKPVIKTLTKYLLEKSKGNSTVNARLQALLSGKDDGSKGTLGLILTERLINIPTEIVPPMYKMLLEEIEWALEENEPYAFTDYLIISKTYKEVASVVDKEDEETVPPKAKKFKSRLRAPGVAAGGSSKAKKDEVFYFHPEDELIEQQATGTASYKYTKINESGADAKRTFSDIGIAPQGHMILISSAEFPATVEKLGNAFKP